MNLRNRKNSNKRSKKLFGGSANVGPVNVRLAGLKDMGGLPNALQQNGKVQVSTRILDELPPQSPTSNSAQPQQPVSNPTQQTSTGAVGGARSRRRSQKRSNKRRQQRQRQQKSRRVTRRKQRQSNKRQRRK